MKTISAQELKKKMEEHPEVPVINVLPKEYFDKKHITGSKNIQEAELEERIPKELPDKEKEVIVYCASTECQASPRSAKKLEEMGYKNVIDFEAGVQGWEEAGFELEGSES